MSTDRVETRSKTLRQTEEMNMEEAQRKFAEVEAQLKARERAVREKELEFRERKVELREREEMIRQNKQEEIESVSYILPANMINR